jgi:hypothetical protein
MAPPIDAQIAATDAATDAVTDTAIDAFAPTAVVPGTEVPDFACLGWSIRRGLVACIVGSRGFNVGDSTVSLVFKPLRPGVEAPEPITLLQRTENEGRGPDELLAAQASELAAQLRGFVTLDRSAAVEAHFVDDHLVVTPAVTAGGATLSLRATRHGTVVFAPKVRAQLTLRLPGHPRQVLETEEGAIGGYTAHLFALDRAIVVERRYHIGDEGTSGNVGDVWVCIAGQCDSEPTEPTNARPR